MSLIISNIFQQKKIHNFNAKYIKQRNHIRSPFLYPPHYYMTLPAKQVPVGWTVYENQPSWVGFLRVYGLFPACVYVISIRKFKQKKNTQFFLEARKNCAFHKMPL